MSAEQGQSLLDNAAPTQAPDCDVSREDLLEHMAAYPDQNSVQFLSMLSVVNGAVVCSVCERALAKHPKKGSSLPNSSSPRGGLEKQPSVVCQPAPMPDWSANQSQSSGPGYGAAPPAQPGYAPPQQQQPGGYVPPQQQQQPGGYIPPPGSLPPSQQQPVAGQPVMGAAVPPSHMSQGGGPMMQGGGMMPPAQAAPAQPGSVHQVAMAAASGAGPTSIITAAPESHLRAQDGPEEQGTYTPTAIAPFETRIVLMTNAWCMSCCFIAGSLIFGWAIMPHAWGWDAGVPIGIVGTVITFLMVWGYLRSQAIAGTKQKAEYKYLELKNPETLEQYYQRLIMYDQAAPAMIFRASTTGHSAVGDFRYTNWKASAPLITFEQLQEMIGGARWVQIIPKLRIMYANGLTKVSYNTQIKEFRQVNERGAVIYITESLSLKPQPAPGVPAVIEHAELGSSWLCVRPGTPEELSKSLFPCNALQKGSPEQFVNIPTDVKVLEVVIEKSVDTLAVVAHA